MQLTCTVKNIYNAMPYQAHKMKTQHDKNKKRVTQIFIPSTTSGLMSDFETFTIIQEFFSHSIFIYLTIEITKCKSIVDHTHR